MAKRRRDRSTSTASARRRRSARRTAWDTLSPRKRAQRLAALAAGRKRLYERLGRPWNPWAGLSAAERERRRAKLSQSLRKTWKTYTPKARTARTQSTAKALRAYIARGGRMGPKSGWNPWAGISPAERARRRAKLKKSIQASWDRLDAKQRAKRLRAVAAGRERFRASLGKPYSAWDFVNEAARAKWRANMSRAQKARWATQPRSGRDTRVRRSS